MNPRKVAKRVTKLRQELSCLGQKNMKIDSEKKKGYTTVLLEMALSKTTKVPASSENKVHFIPDRAQPKHIRQSLEKVFSASIA